jgi:hypothetical protein
MGSHRAGPQLNGNLEIGCMQSGMWAFNAALSAWVLFCFHMLYVCAVACLVAGYQLAGA